RLALISSESAAARIGLIGFCGITLRRDKSASRIMQGACQGCNALDCLAPAVPDPHLVRHHMIEAKFPVPSFTASTRANAVIPVHQHGAGDISVNDAICGAILK